MGVAVPAVIQIIQSKTAPNRYDLSFNGLFIVQAKGIQECSMAFIAQMRAFEAMNWIKIEDESYPLGGRVVKYAIPSDPEMIESNNA